MATKTEIQKYDSAIKKGIKFLDKRFGRKVWSKKVDIEILDLGDFKTCMIGEVVGDYNKGAEAFNKTDDEMEKLGFYGDDYGLLTRLWIGALYKLGIKG